ncbi:YopJ family acetyltransferase [Paracidovorax citrulli]|uniref:YopJ family acetyltransferase n=1 Tax=Paracidovorax citrulli TaxID=80869 RepID=UPI001305403B|nr:YopJ family acetyltransferase [Paracidovorax citrulli]UEG46895.1 hypothetical protein LKW27_03185 [Paracidovorax citrulli]WIY35357.1 YopJ family acetyltransferase [Paracidovorax citrulli]
MLTPLHSTRRDTGLPCPPPQNAAEGGREASRSPGSSSRLASPQGLEARPVHGAAPTRRRGPDFDEELAAQRKPHLLSYLRLLESRMADRTERPVTGDTNEDMYHLDDLMQALNTADPSLQLRRYAFEFDQRCTGLAQSGLVSHLLQGMQNQAQWNAIFDRDGKHRSAASIRCAEHAASFVVVDSLAADSITEKAHTDIWQRVLGQLQWFLERKRNFAEPHVQLRAHVVFTHAQKSSEGCTIFALSAARKMASATAIADLHQQALAPRPSDSWAEPEVKFLAASVLPPAFMKHATSASVLRDYLEKRRQGPVALEPGHGAVNKRGETLLERHAAYAVTRPKAPAPEPTWMTPILQCLGLDTGPNMVTYSDSYAHKRIEFVRLALAHFAPPVTGSSPQ